MLSSKYFVRIIHLRDGGQSRSLFVFLFRRTVRWGGEAPPPHRPTKIKKTKRERDCPPSLKCMILTEYFEESMEEIIYCDGIG